MLNKLFSALVLVFTVLYGNVAFAEGQHSTGWPNYTIGYTSCNLQNPGSDITQANIGAIVFNTGYEDLNCQITRGYLGPNHRPEGTCESSKTVIVPSGDSRPISSSCISGVKNDGSVNFSTDFLITCTSVTWPDGEGRWSGGDCK